jgi:hypothetical protein
MQVAPSTGLTECNLELNVFIVDFTSTVPMNGRSGALIASFELGMIRTPSFLLIAMQFVRLAPLGNCEGPINIQLKDLPSIVTDPLTSNPRKE